MSSGPSGSGCGEYFDSTATGLSQEDRTFRPYGYGTVFPSFSPRSSGAGDTEFDWTTAEEKILRDVASWLSPADLRRARLVCKSWCGALATITTKAVTPPEATVCLWKGQLEALILAFPCLQVLTVGSRLSSMAAQQLGVLAGAKQLHTLNIPHGQALQDRSLLAMQPLAQHLRELRIHGAASLSRRSLLLLSVLANLEVLELRNCGKVSWNELQQAWRAACVAYEAYAAAEAAQGANAASSSGGGSSGSAGASSSGGGSSLGSKLSAWLPAGRLFRTSSPSSSSIQSALAWQRASPGILLAKVQDLARGTSGAAAVAVTQLGIGAVGNGRSSCGGASPISTARTLLHRKQKLGAAASFTAYEDAVAHLGATRSEGDAGGTAPNRSSNSGGGSSSSSSSSSSVGGGGIAGCFPMRGGPLARLRVRSALLPRAGDDEDSPRAASMLSRVGSLVWATSPPAPASSLGSSLSFGGSSSSSSTTAVQTSSVQAALLAYIAEEEQEAAAAELSLPAVAPAVSSSAVAGPSTASSGGGTSNAGSGGGTSNGGRAGQAGSTVGDMPLAAQALSSRQPGAAAAAAAPAPAGTCHAAVGQQQQQQQQRPYKPRRRTTGDKGLPAMPFTKLKALAFSCSEVTLKAATHELAAVAALTSLTSLDISKCKLPDPVFGQLRGLGRLATLRLSGLWSMGDAGLAQLAQLSTLQSLALSEAMHVTAQGLQALSQLTGLTSLAMGLTQDVGQGALARMAVALPLLQCLEVAGPSWGDLDCELLARHAAAGAAAGGSGNHNQQQQQQQTPARAVQEPQMLWDVAAVVSAASLSHSASSSAASRAVSAKQLLPGLHSAGASSSSSRSRTASSSLSVRVPSFSSCRTPSFGTFPLFASSQGQGQGRGWPGVAQQAPQQLLVLRLHGSRGLTTPRGVAALKQLPALHTLLLDSCREVPAAEAVSQGLLPPRLASLALRGLPFGNLFAGCVSSPACAMHLTRLELASLEGVHEGQLRRLLSFFPRISHLSLAGCGGGVTDAALAHLPMLANLAHLDLGGTAVTGRQSFEHLCGLPRLATLVLKGCGQLADAGLEGLLGAPALEVLDVSECGGLGEEGLRAAMLGLPRLVRLDVSGCRGAGRALLAERPHYLHLQHSLV